MKPSSLKLLFVECRLLGGIPIPFFSDMTLPRILELHFPTSVRYFHIGVTSVYLWPSIVPVPYRMYLPPLLQPRLRLLQHTGNQTINKKLCKKRRQVSSNYCLLVVCTKYSVVV